jgi:serine/threonine protein kinase
MPAPANADEFLDLIQKSGVVDEAKLRVYIQKLSETTGVPPEPAKLASHLVRDGVLTFFQAEQILQGKYKRFSIGKYKVLEKLGSGGMASVFLCEHKLMRRRVAIKVLPTAKADDPSSLARFYREARAVAALDHPNIVRAYDIDQDENLHFLVMEYVDGTNLHDLIKKFGPLDILRACHYIYAAAVGLQHANEMGLIHRDIKPGNILIDRAGVVKILDMGLARFFEDEEDHLTKKYDENVLGTADYLAPEQAIDSHTVDTRADIYSLGATFYYLLTASALFPEGSVAQKLIWHQNRQPRPIRSLRPELPDEIVAIVEKMMAKDPNQRYQTPADLMVALAPWVTTPIPPPGDREMPQVSLAAGGGFRSPTNLATANTTFFPRYPSGGTPDAPTVVASVQTTPTQAIPTIHGTPINPIPALPALHSPSELGATASTSTSPVWETLDEPLLTIAKPDSEHLVTPPQPPSQQRKNTSTKAPARSLLFFLSAGLIVVAITAIGAFLTFFNKAQPPTPPPTSSHRITVTTAGGEFAVPTLRAALSRVGPGDTIVIAEAKLTEPGLKLDKTKHKDLTIESASPDKPVVIENKDNSGIMLDITGIEGLHLKNLEFEGKDLAAIGVQISGVCPGLVLENVTLRNMKAAGLQLLNARGDANRPMILDRIRVANLANNTTGITLNAAATVDNRWIVLRNSRFEGRNTTEGTGIRVEGVATDFEVSGNRFFNLATAVALGRPPKDKTVRAKLTSNTIFQSGTGLLFDLTPPAAVANEAVPVAGKFDLAIAQNYFGKTGAVGQVNGVNPPLEGIQGSDNLFGPETNPGNLGLPLAPLPTLQLLSTNPNDEDAKFLHFPSGPPEWGPNRVKIGAP